MCGNSLGFVVCTFNQASHQPDLNPGAALHSDMRTAIIERDWKRKETAKSGRGEIHVIAEVFEVDEDSDG